MASEEIGFADLVAVGKRGYKLIFLLALVCGLATYLIIVGFMSPEYLSTARVVVQLPAIDDDTGGWPLEVYVGLLGSGRILGQTKRELVTAGFVSEQTELALDKNLQIRAERRDDGASSPMVALDAWSDDPEASAAIANTWAEVFLKLSAQMLQTTVAESETVLGESLSPTRVEMAELEAELDQKLNDLETREQEASARWDRQIASVRESAETEIALHNTATRRMMEASVSSHVENPEASVRAQLLQLISVRAQLAQTPRILTLERAASDEMLADLIAAGKPAETASSTWESQEINPLFDELALRVVEIEGEIERSASEQAGGVTAAMAELERIQLERAAALAALVDDKSLRASLLRRRKGGALEALGRERSQLNAEYARRLDQLADLEAQLSKRLNRSVISGLLEEVDPAHLAVRATPQSVPESRQVVLKVMAAAFLGGMLGLMIALFRSSG